MLQFTAADGKRRSVRLGKVSQRNAEAVRVRVEALVAASLTGHSIDDDTARWVAGLDDVMTRRLANAGLVPKRETATLAAFVDKYIGSRRDVKPQTATIWRHTRRCLVSHFGANKPLRDITPGDADGWRLWLITDEGLAENTARRRCGLAKQFFNAAVRRRLIGANPFADLAASARSNRSRDRFITREEIERVIEACPDCEWRLIVALSRYGGLRCPSEHLALRWADVDWERGRVGIPSSKTAHHEGGESRMIPLFPELLPHLREVFEQAAPGTEYIITRYRATNTNLRTQLAKIIKRAGLEPWPKMFHNLRASRETELAEDWPLHVVCAWIGNTQPVAAKHYLQVTDDHFTKAAGASSEGPSEGVEKALQKAMQQVHVSPRKAPQAPGDEEGKTAFFGSLRQVAGQCESKAPQPMGAGGFEPPKANANGFTARPLWPLGYTPWGSGH